MARSSIQMSTTTCNAAISAPDVVRPPKLVVRTVVSRVDCVIVRSLGCLLASSPCRAFTTDALGSSLRPVLISEHHDTSNGTLPGIHH